MRSAAVDGADAIGVAVEGDAEIAFVLAHERPAAAPEFSATGRVGMMGGEAAVDGLVEQDGGGRAAAPSAPPWRAPAAPLPASQATVSGRPCGAPSPIAAVRRSTYESNTDRLANCAGRAASRRRHAAAILPSSWMAAPKNAALPSIILKPLWVGGLCEPVIMTPASAFSVSVAK